MTKNQPFEVVESFDDFELRHYPECILAQVTTAGPFMRAGNSAFYPLFNYISGANQTQTKIAMTAPVIQHPGADESHVISFVMPEGMKAADVPAPTGSTVTTRVVPEHYSAVRKFRGSWQEDRFRIEGERLLLAVRQAGLKTIGDLYWARFDPPFKPGFMKHNEVLIDLER
ncbi:heme-binding protein [Rhodoluna sp.]|uniref:SOUL family heme-binding protein n=1 Tax=Rhodoluna sp. TaxID=1969481 RepID=UPI0025FA930D|nr:heme-binding protein [Rhodoluna sp.]